jgi:hypothetical protein
MPMSAPAGAAGYAAEFGAHNDNFDAILRVDNHGVN